MQYSDKRLKNFIFVSLATILLFSVIQISLVKNNATLPTDNDPRYIVAQNAATKAFSAAVLVMLAVFAAFALFAVKKTRPKCVTFNDSPTIFFSALIGFMSVSTAALLIYHYAANKLAFFNIDGAVVLALLPMSAYFFHTSSRARKEGNSVYITLSFFPVIYTVLRVLAVFIPARESAADSAMLFRLFGLAFMMLFFVTELKSAGGSPNRKASVFFGLSAILLSLLFQIPDIVLSAFWLFKFNITSVLTAVDLFVSLYIAARLIAMTERPEEKMSSENAIQTTRIPERE